MGTTITPMGNIISSVLGTAEKRNQFVLDGFEEGTFKNPPVPVLLPWNLDRDDLLGFADKKKLTPKPFQGWLSKLQENLKLQGKEAHTFHSNPFKIKEIDVQTVDWFGPIDPKTGKGDKPGFVKMQVKVENEDEKDGKGEVTKKRDILPGAVFLRGGSVGMLIILQPTDNADEKYALLTIQPRVAVSSLAFAEIPAGMIEDDSFTGTAAREIKEETTLEVLPSQLFDLSSKLVTQSSISPWKKDSTPPQTKDGNEVSHAMKENLHNAMYPSMGACDEYLPLFLCQKKVPRDKLEALQGRATGLREEGEKITLKVVPLDELCVHGGRDGKALAAYALYRYHKEKNTPGINDVYEDKLEKL